jgi:hypothetical protein
VPEEPLIIPLDPLVTPEERGEVIQPAPEAATQPAGAGAEIFQIRHWSEGRSVRIRPVRLLIPIIDRQTGQYRAARAGVLVSQSI